MLSFLVTAALVCMVIVPITFIWHKVYTDGLIGRIGLGGITLLASIRLLREIDGKAADIPLEIQWLLLSMAVFLIWHLVRFHSRVLREKKKAQATFAQGSLQ